MTPSELNLLVDASRAALDATGQATGSMVRALFHLSMGSLDDDALAGYLERSVPMVNAGQRTGAQATARATARLLGASGGLPPVVPTLVTAQTPWLSSPVIRLRSLLAEGMEYPIAKDTASRYAAALTIGDVQAAGREGAQQAADHLSDTVDGPIAWTKVPAAGCCDWCQRLSTRLFRKADTVAMHAGDHCGFRPVTSDHWDFEFFSNSASIFRNQRHSRFH